MQIYLAGPFKDKDATAKLARAAGARVFTRAPVTAAPRCIVLLEAEPGEDIACEMAGVPLGIVCVSDKWLKDSVACYEPKDVTGFKLVFNKDESSPAKS